jgi:hypothetical protein
MINIYLDVDGVLNAVSRRPPRTNTGWEGEWSDVNVLGFPILYSHEVVNHFNEFAQMDGVVVKWLTTWQEKAAQELSPLIGINGQEWEVLYGDINDHWFTTGRWWKLEAIQNDIVKSKPDKVVWVDDDLGYDRSAQGWLADKDFIHVVSPNTNHGVTKKQISGIIEFINT